MPITDACSAVRHTYNIGNIQIGRDSCELERSHAAVNWAQLPHAGRGRHGVDRTELSPPVPPVRCREFTRPATL